MGQGEGLAGPAIMGRILFPSKQTLGSPCPVLPVIVNPRPIHLSFRVPPFILSSRPAQGCSLVTQETDATHRLFSSLPKPRRCVHCLVDNGSFWRRIHGAGCRSSSRWGRRPQDSLSCW
ncbi:hypothetical protein LY76DRAFT_240539 [Colletotrichum caudatum]|nr:hypothetical protein LY76DRAFT_240539 [Colletotrichum caudatum]